MELSVDHNSMAALGHALVQMGEGGIHFHLIFSRPCREGLAFSLLIQRDLERLAAAHLDLPAVRNGETCGYQTSTAELVFFQGPHFGDRYGIAEVAVEALASNAIEMTAIVCSGACIYIVLPEGKADEAVVVLGETFEIPKVSPRNPPEVSRKTT